MVSASRSTAMPIAGYGQVTLYPDLGGILSIQVELYTIVTLNAKIFTAFGLSQLSCVTW